MAPDWSARNGGANGGPGPVYETIQHVGVDEFRRAAVKQARGQLRDGLPLRAEIKAVGYLARKAEGTGRE